jgi:hypothetical protein
MIGAYKKKEVVVFDPIDTDFLQPIYKDSNRKRIIGHYPSGNKGYNIIFPVIEKLKNEIDFEFRYSNEKVYRE